MDVETVATYDRIAGRFADQWLTSHMDRFAAGVRADGLVVDLGCGPGRDVSGGGALFVSAQAGSGTGTKSSSGSRRFTFWDADRLAAAVGAAGFEVAVVETAAVDPSTGVSWIGLHASRSGGEC